MWPSSRSSAFASATLRATGSRRRTEQRRGPGRRGDHRPITVNVSVAVYRPGPPPAVGEAKPTRVGQTSPETGLGADAVREQQVGGRWDGDRDERSRRRRGDGQRKIGGGECGTGWTVSA